MLSGASVPVSAQQLGCVECVPPRAKWHRTSRVLLLLSVVQIATSIYIYLDRKATFFVFYLAYALSACALMALRVKVGLLWFACGSLLYGVWLSVLMWRAMSDRNWVEMCLDFALAAFELLVFCLAVGRFHELGGFAVCCGPPDRNAWKGELLMGSSDESSAWHMSECHRAVAHSQSRQHAHSAADGSAAIDGYAHQQGVDAEHDAVEGEHEVYLNVANSGASGASSNLPASLYNSGPEQSVVYSTTTQFSIDKARYQPPMPQRSQHQRQHHSELPLVGSSSASYSPSSQMFSDLSSVSSSYVSTVGRGMMLQPGQTHMHDLHDSTA